VVELRLQQVTLKRAGRTLFGALDLTLRGGECWAILGPNGVGKSSLLHLLAGLLPPETGTLTLDDQPLTTLARRALAQRLALLLQQQHDPFPSRVLESALLGRHPHLGPWGIEGEVDLAIATAALARVDLTGMEQRLVDELSGGERQRLAIATLLCQQAQVMLLDEPNNHLDLRHQQALLRHFQTLARAGDLVVMALHDPNLAARYASHVLLLHASGAVLHGEATTLLTSERLATLYDVAFDTVDGPVGRLFLPH